jgi:hypothetical protein
LPSYDVFVPVGNYERTAIPAPPLDRIPPVKSNLAIFGADPASNTLVLGSDKAPLDDPSRLSRTATVTRVDGVGGFRVWLRDAYTLERISSEVTLGEGQVASALLDTVGASEMGSLRPNVDLVLAPPAGAALPRLESAILNGFGLDQTYPDLPPPARVAGTLVFSNAGNAMPLGSATVTFDSVDIVRKSPDSAVTYLKYTFSTTTDEGGGYDVRLPLGTYDAFVEPPYGATLAKSRERITVDHDLAFDFVAPPPSEFSGDARTQDGRPLTEAEVVLTPRLSDDKAAAATALHFPWTTPRAARTLVDADGHFRLLVDEGDYDVSVIPARWTNFPRTSVARSVRLGQAGVAAISAPAPSYISLTVRGPEGLNPVPFAVVRAFAKLRGESRYTEIGNALTDASGKFEIFVLPKL